MSGIRRYQDLEVWQRAMQLTVTIYKETDSFPKAEVYGLTNQIRCAAVSIPSNMAEGHGRSNKDFGRFFAIARGSLAELETQLELARRIGYLPQPNFNALNNELAILGKQLNLLAQRVQAAIQ